LRRVRGFVAHGLFGFSRAAILPVKRPFERIYPLAEVCRRDLSQKEHAMIAVISRPRDRRHFRLGASVAALVVSAVVVGSAFKGPKPTSTPATATFRCDFYDSACATNDRVRDDDGGPYSGFINSGTFDLQVASGRSLRLYLVDFITGSRTCVPMPSPSTCNPSGPLDQQPQPLSLTINASIRVKALTPPPYQDLAGGLTAMRCGATNQPGLVHFTWWMPDNDGHWGFNFNPRDYPGTSAATLTRESAGRWRVETVFGINDVGELLSWAHSGIKRHDGPSHEGRFDVPFEFTIEASGMTCPS
jgi:hypothetical protein